MDFRTEKFLGIRYQNGVADYAGGVVSSLECKNIDFYKTGTGDAIGIKTTTGRQPVKSLEGSKIIGYWTSNQDNYEYRYVYAETTTDGTLYFFNNNEFTPIIENLSVTGRANGITITQGMYDIFVFTNGDDMYSYCESTVPKKNAINAIDDQLRQIKGISLATQAQRLVIECDNRVHWSKQLDIYTWNANATDSEGKPLSTNSHYEEFTNRVTAVANYIEGIIAFTQFDSTFMSGNPASLTEFVRQDAAIGGTPCYSSVVVHDKYLFYYDHRQRNIYYFIQNDVGQKRTGTPVATEIDRIFAEVDNTYVTNTKMYSVYSAGINEIWVLLPTGQNKQRLMIYDYAIQEWKERTADYVNDLNLYDDGIYTCQGDTIYREYRGPLQDVCSYKINTLNFGSDTNLKIPKLLPVVTINYENDCSNTFWVRMRIDGKPKRKEKLVKSKYINDSTWGDDTNDTTPAGSQTWDVAEWVEDRDFKARKKLPPIQSFRWVELTFLTKEVGQEFDIQCFELKRIRQKTKTL